MSYKHLIEKHFSRLPLEPNLKKSFWRFGCAAAFAFLLSQTSLAQKLVDLILSPPNSAPPRKNGVLNSSS